MSGPTADSDFPPSLVLEYRLTESDVRHYCVSGRFRKSLGACRRRKVAVGFLLALGLFLVGICTHARGVRSGALALGTGLAVLTVLAWSRQAKADREVCRLAREMGLPEDFRLVVSPRGIVELPSHDLAIPGRTFEWVDVLEIRRVDGLIVAPLRPGRCVLIVPDRAFPSDQARTDFLERARAWKSGNRIS